MNVGAVVFLLLLLAVGVFGMIFVASHVSTTPTADVYGRMPANSTNMTQQNMTATAPTGINLMGYAAVVVGILVVVVAGVAIASAAGGGYGTGNRR